MVNICDPEITLLFKVRYHKHISQLPKPCHGGIHLGALAEHYQISTTLPGFHPFFHFFSQIMLCCPNQPPVAQGLTTRPCGSYIHTATGSTRVNPYAAGG